MVTKTMRVKPRKNRTKDTTSPSDPFTQYRNTLTTRYASAAMSQVFSERHRAQIWRELWIILADEERKLGLPISSKQIASLEAAKEDIDFDDIREFEKKLKHDVMSHLKAFAKVAPEGEPILHLGATSAFITDNADALILKQATHLVLGKLQSILKELGALMLKYRAVEMTGFTHFQPAQPVTLGKRIALWAQDLIWDVEELVFSLERYRPLGCKGTTGTQASFAVLFKGDAKKVQALDRAVCERMGFQNAVAVSGQTLSRKSDTWFLNALANLAASFSKMSYDMRLLQHLREVTEPFGSDQIGSSAMPYKQNPMLAERITGLSRFLIVLAQNGPFTHATQWLERSLDDSSNRRIVLPEAFLTADALCEATHRLLKGLRVNEDEIEKRLEQYRSIFETEALMMEGTLEGGSRQELHEQIRKATVQKKSSGDKQAEKMLKGKKVSQHSISGMAADQVDRFHQEILAPKLKELTGIVGSKNVEFGSAPI